MGDCGNNLQTGLHCLHVCDGDDICEIVNAWMKLRTLYMYIQSIRIRQWEAQDHAYFKHFIIRKSCLTRNCLVLTNSCFHVIENEWIVCTGTCFFNLVWITNCHEEKSQSLKLDGIYTWNIDTIWKKHAVNPALVKAFGREWKNSKLWMVKNNRI